MVDASDRTRKLLAAAFAQQYRTQTSNISTGVAVFQKELYSEVGTAQQYNFICSNDCTNPSYTPFANQFSGCNVQDRCNPKFSWQTSSFTTYYY
jgi:hypothetical protein